MHAACCVHHCLCTPKNKKEEKKGNAASFTGFCLNSESNSKFIRQNMSSSKRRKVATTEYKLVHICQACRDARTKCDRNSQSAGVATAWVWCAWRQNHTRAKEGKLGPPLTVINNMIVTILSSIQNDRGFGTILLPSFGGGLYGWNGRVSS